MNKLRRLFVDAYCSPRRRVFARLLAGKTFVAAGKTYPYFVRKEHRTGTNERAVEIPIVMELFNAHINERILEIGNVLSNWESVSHTIVDRYEESPLPNVLNVDIVDYAPQTRFDLIMSVSTFEHVGWDESPRCPEKVLRAFAKVKELLLPHGQAIITVPVGLNPFLDNALKSGEIKTDKILCLKRISIRNYWGETSLDEAMKCEFGRPYDNANGLMIVYLSGRTPI